MLYIRTCSIQIDHVAQRSKLARDDAGPHLGTARGCLITDDAKLQLQLSRPSSQWLPKRKHSFRWPSRQWLPERKNLKRHPQPKQ